MRYRYTGTDESRDLAMSGGVIQFPRMQWVDPYKVAAEIGIAEHHLPIILRGLGPDWQAEGPVKAARTRKKKAAAPPEIDDQGDEPETPAEPDEEQS